ncbi:hypothetical protein TKK_0009950 [Trichogramma kaykai]|uniref:SAM domain-containing protein n=1 Tax=Trichogramma kaykai TaxID=54128 RepID=A0ABD2WZ01_9HYME
MTNLTNTTKKHRVELQVIDILKTTNYSLNIVSRHKENIVHISAANNCTNIIKCILGKYNKYCLERKNAFGWTPLMHAIRNQHFQMVQLLLYSGAIVNDFSFLGLSVLSLACAISEKMFDLVYKNDPGALENAAHDDINPLCVAALKNDKNLFFKLISLGLKVDTANIFTHTMMKRSSVPEIVALAKSNSFIEDYWNDLTDIHDFVICIDNGSISNTTNNVIREIDISSSKLNNFIPAIHINDSDTKKWLKYSKREIKSFQYLELSVNDYLSKNDVSPMLTYSNKFVFPTSPNVFVAENNSCHEFEKFKLDIGDKGIPSELCDASSNVENNLNNDEVSPLVLKRCQHSRPPSLRLRSASNDSDITLSFTPKFSPSKSPNALHNNDEENVFDDSTPTPPKYRTPPNGIILDPGIRKLIHILKRFGFNKHIPVFIAQEVDLELFYSLSDRDLQEIGFEEQADRNKLLCFINKYSSTFKQLYNFNF